MAKANVVARARGYRKDGTARAAEATRLGDSAAQAVAATGRTHGEMTVFADGSGAVEVWQNGRVIHRFAWGSENVQPGVLFGPHGQ